MNSSTLTPSQRAELIATLCECYPLAPGMNASADFASVDTYLASLTDAQLLRMGAKLGVILECAD